MSMHPTPIACENGVRSSRKREASFVTHRRSSDNWGAFLLFIMIVATVFVWSNYGALGGLLTLAAIILGLIFIGTWDERADARRVQWQLEQVAQRGAVVEATRNMSGAEFEQLMAHLFRSRGYKAQMTKASGDQGMDLLLNKDGRRMAVQLKRYSKPVGNRA